MSPHANRRAPASNGAYGLRLSGVEGIEEFLVEAPDHWTPLELILRAGPVDMYSGWIAPRSAEFVTLSGNLIQLDLDRREAILTAPSMPRAEEVVHPYLSSIGAMTAHLMGQESFHAGAVKVEGSAWAIAGDREAGKSSTLASLAAHGFPVVCDDTLVLSAGKALAGPRSIDLRRDAADTLGLGDELGVVGTRERWRMHVEPIEPELELRGWVFLEWADELEITSLSTPETLSHLIPRRAVRLPPEQHTTLIDLARLPALLLRRPRGLDRLPATIEALAGAISSSG
jgi:hypothetical protein